MTEMLEKTDSEETLTDSYNNAQSKSVWSSLRRDRHQTILNQIRVDLHRTFSGNKSAVNSHAGTEQLERILHSYSIRNENLGYCQVFCTAYIL